ncbi:MAG: hypothetical protein LBD14_02935 [Puniceicoccales bacterium]|jgi:hypothetical protein|nr:hypothetical protein [Puniceicoccales bacterium]
MRQQKEIQKALQATLYFLRCLSSELRTENSDTGRLLTFSQGFLEQLSRSYFLSVERADFRQYEIPNLVWTKLGEPEYDIHVISYWDSIFSIDEGIMHLGQFIDEEEREPGSICYVDFLHVLEHFNYGWHCLKLSREEVDDFDQDAFEEITNHIPNINGLFFEEE